MQSKKKASKPLMIIVAILFAILFIILIATSGNNNTNDNVSNTIRTDYTYDDLQKVFLEITPDTTPNDVLTFAEQYNLCYSEEWYRMSKSNSYKLSYSEEVAKFKYPKEGDYIQIDFDETNHLENAEYFNTDAYYSNNIYKAILYVSGTYWEFYAEGMDGDYSGYYGYKRNSKKDGITIKYTNGNSTETNYYSFDSAKAVINCIIDNADKYDSSSNDKK